MALWSVLDAVRPAPEGGEVVTLRRDVSAATPLTADDLHLVPVTDPARPADALVDTSEALGRITALGLPAGTVLSESMLTGAALVDGLPSGLVLAPVRLADAEVVGLLRPGDRIDLVTTVSDAAGSPGPAHVVAESALVVAQTERDDGGFLGASRTESTLILVGVSETDAVHLVAANAWAPLRAVLVPG